MEQKETTPIEELAKQYINIDSLSEEDKKNKDKVVATAEDAIQGALDIIAENISDNADYRKKIKKICYREGILTTSATKPDEKSNYEMYYDYSELVCRIPSHRILAINRGEKEEFLKVKLEKKEEKILYYIERDVIKGETQFTQMLKDTILDSFKRLIEPSIDREIRSDLTEKAEEKAIKVFGKNAKQLLLGAPIKGKTVMGFDPEYRTGCKIAVIDETGKVLDYTTVYPTEPQNDTEGAKKELLKLIIEENLEGDDENIIISLQKNYNDYLFTEDNFIKMALVFLRIRAGIPTIIMGETGCGKTYLIKMFSYIYGKDSKSVYILKFHAGTTEDDIIKFIINSIYDANKEENRKIKELMENFERDKAKDIFSFKKREEKLKNELWFFQRWFFVSKYEEQYKKFNRNI